MKAYELAAVGEMVLLKSHLADALKRVAEIESTSERMTLQQRMILSQGDLLCKWVDALSGCISDPEPRPNGWLLWEHLSAITNYLFSAADKALNECTEQNAAPFKDVSRLGAALNRMVTALQWSGMRSES